MIGAIIVLGSRHYYRISAFDDLGNASAYSIVIDAGVPIQPVAVDYTQVTGSTGYNSANGYGWQSGPVYSVNRGGDDLSRDLNYTRDATFAVDVVNGEYDIVVTMGAGDIGRVAASLAEEHCR